jgi:hypothetical protein
MGRKTPIQRLTVAVLSVGVGQYTDRDLRGVGRDQFAWMIEALREGVSSARRLRKQLEALHEGGVRRCPTARRTRTYRDTYREQESAFAVALRAVRGERVAFDHADSAVARTDGC